VTEVSNVRLMIRARARASQHFPNFNIEFPLSLIDPALSQTPLPGTKNETCPLLIPVRLPDMAPVGVVRPAAALPWNETHPSTKSFFHKPMSYKEGWAFIQSMSLLSLFH